MVEAVGQISDETVLLKSVPSQDLGHTYSGAVERRDCSTRAATAGDGICQTGGSYGEVALPSEGGRLCTGGKATGDWKWRLGITGREFKGPPKDQEYIG